MGQKTKEIIYYCDKCKVEYTFISSLYRIRLDHKKSPYPRNEIVLELCEECFDETTSLLNEIIQKL